MTEARGILNKPNGAQRKEALAHGKRWCSKCFRFRGIGLFPKHTDGVSSQCITCKERYNKTRRFELVGHADPTIQARLDAFTDKSGGPDACWPWLARKNSIGFGHILYKGHAHAMAHRVWFEVATGHVFTGRDQRIKSTCDTKGCVNPRHWTLKTTSVNARRNERLHTKTKDRILQGIEAVVELQPREVRDELRQCLVLEVLTRSNGKFGKVTPAKLKAALAAAWDSQPNRFAASLDEPLTDDEDEARTFLDVQESTDFFGLDPMRIVEFRQEVTRRAKVEARWMWCD